MLRLWNNNSLVVALRMLRKYGWWRIETLRIALHKIYEGAIVIYGPPSAGKDSLAEVLKHLLFLKVVSIGALMRQANKRNPQAFPEIDSGVLANSENAVRLMKGVFSKLRDKYGLFVSAGSPRAVDETKMVRPDICLAVKMDVIFKVCEQRVNRRRAADTLFFWRKRKDDDPRIFEERYDRYYRRTEPVVTYLESAGVKVVTVDANGTLLQTTGILLEKLFAICGV